MGVGTTLFEPNDLEGLSQRFGHPQALAHGIQPRPYQPMKAQVRRRILQARSEVTAGVCRVGNVYGPSGKKLRSRFFSHAQQESRVTPINLQIRILGSCEVPSTQSALKLIPQWRVVGLSVKGCVGYQGPAQLGTVLILCWSPVGFLLAVPEASGDVGRPGTLGAPTLENHLRRLE